MNFTSSLLLFLANKCPVKAIADSAYRKYGRWNKGVVQTIDTTFGFKMNCIIGCDSVDNAIAIKKSADLVTDYLYLAFFKDCNGLVDVGCNIGYYTCLYLANNSNGRAVAIDPNPEMVERTRENLALNGFDTRAGAHQKGVGSKKEVLTLNIAKHRHSLSSFAYELQRGGGTGKKVDVEVNTLGNILHDWDFPESTFLKIDTEGFEENVFKGLTAELISNVSVISFELSSRTLKGANSSATAIARVPWLSEFDSFEIKGIDRLSPVIISEFDSFKDDYHRDLLLIKKGYALPANVRIEQES